MERFIALALVLVASSLGAQSASVTLAWNASTDPTVVGYNFYYGGASRAYTNMVNVGNVTNHTVSGLVQGSTYFFAATCYTLAGLESDYSIEAVYTVPTPPPVIVTGPASATNNVGGTQTFTVTATGGSLTYKWLKNGIVLANGGNVSGATTATLTLSSLTGSDNGGYVVQVTGAGGTTTSAVAVLSIIPAAPTGLRVSGP